VVVEDIELGDVVAPAVIEVPLGGEELEAAGTELLGAGGVGSANDGVLSS
jgi:hypothetical protein